MVEHLERRLGDDRSPCCPLGEEASLQEERETSRWKETEAKVRARILAIMDVLSYFSLEKKLSPPHCVLVDV